MSYPSRAMDIYKHLEGQGFSVYFPAQKVGECTSPYVVIRVAPSSQYQGLSTTINYYDLLCYVPRDHYSQLEPFLDSVKNSMREMYPMIRPTYTQTQSYYDESVKGHMSSIQYKNYKKIILP